MKMTTNLILALLLSATAWPQSPGLVDVPMTRENRIKQLDSAIGEIRRAVDVSKAESAKAVHDVRGLTLLDYVEKWAFTPEVMQEVPRLLDQARAGKEDAPIDRAEELVNVASARSQELRAYWAEVPQISWRDRWTAFAKANRLDPAVVDPAVSSQESSLIEALDSGSFLVAARHTQNLDQLLDDAINRSSAEVMRNRKPADVAFAARKSACPAPVAAATTPGPKARIAESGDPDALYPADAKARGEHGAIVVRARVAADGCAKSLGVVVSSGYPALDAAAIAVAEAGRYLAAVENGKAVASDLTFKVRFDLK
ncbi:MAG TPA: TonB family protein [Steroidobacteraceae bacterium]|nr:TonB family protein [Steroidobacteraceae bacterium]